MRSKLFAAIAACCLAAALTTSAYAQAWPPRVRTIPIVPATPTPPAEEETATVVINYTRYNQLVKEAPRYMARFERQRNPLALRYQIMTDEEFEEVRQKIRVHEAGIDRPKSKPRDLANYEKERRAAIARVPKCDKGIFSKKKGKCV